MNLYPKDRCAVLLLCLTFVCPNAFAFGCYPWTEVVTDHFRLVTSLRPKRALPIAESLNRFESAIEIVTSAKDFEAKVPTTIYVLESGDWLSFVPRSQQVSGLFMPDKFENRILAVEPSDHMPTPFTVVMHEYVHYVLSSQRLIYPRWYNEGLAEVLSAALEDETSFRIGLLKGERLDDGMRGPLWIPFEQLFSADARGGNRHDPGYGPVFYGEATVLVHYLMFGSPTRKQELAQYLSALNQGAAPAQAFTEAFHTDFQHLERETRAYAKQRRFDSYRLPLAALAPRRAPRVRTIPCNAASVETGFALLAAHAKPSDVAPWWFIGSDKDDDTAAWRLGKAAAALARKDLPQARKLIDAALHSPRVGGESLVRAAELLLESVPDPASEREPLPDPDRLLLERVAALLDRPEVARLRSSNAAYTRGLTSLRLGRDTDMALDAVVQALERSPKNPYLAEVGALLCERKHDSANAAAAWSIVAAYSPDMQKRAQASQILKAPDSAPRSPEP